MAKKGKIKILPPFPAEAVTIIFFSNYQEQRGTRGDVHDFFLFHP